MCAGFTKTVALETAQAGNVTCNAICPGYVLTDLIRNQLEDTAKARGIPKVGPSSSPVLSSISPSLLTLIASCPGRFLPEV